MDTSEQYIKMCEMAEEIQEEWEPKPFDNFCYRHRREDAPWWWSELDRFGEFNKKRGSHIFLPRQNQLQEMVGKEKEIFQIWDLIREFNFWMNQSDFCVETIIINKKVIKRAKYDLTMEQLWLAFVMSQKHGKRWDGEKWIKEE